MWYNKEYGVFRPTDKKSIDQINEYKKENKKEFHNNLAEQRMWDKLIALKKETRIKFTKQCVWWARIFDFRCDKKGIVVEVDGKHHLHGKQLLKDMKHDKFHTEYSGMVILRVRAFNEQDANYAIERIKSEPLWKDRKLAMWLPTSRERQRQKSIELWYRKPWE